MSILSALKQQNSSIDDLAKLPQAMIMQMAQKKQISQDMLAPILARKAEMMDAVSRSKALQPQPPVPTVMEQVMAKNVQAENPQAMPPQAMPQPMPQGMPEEAGIAQLPVPERQYAGGGIVAFARGDLVGFEDDDEDDSDVLAEYAQAMAAGQRASRAPIDMPDRAQMEIPSGGNAGVGIRPPVEGRKSSGVNYELKGKHPYESLVTAKANEFGVDPRLAAYILNKETGGMKNPENARSSAGAMGIAQFMPATARQYGINPDIPEEAAIGMNKHLRYLMDKYEDPKVAAIAYNWGEGNTNKWLKAGANMDKLPKETKKYVAQLAGGGEVKHFVNDGYVELGGRIDSVGSELDALRSGTKTLQERLRSMGSRNAEGRDEIQSAYDNALRLQKEKETEYEGLMTEGGVNKPSFFPQSSLSSKRPQANPIVKREAVGAPPAKAVDNKSTPAAANPDINKLVAPSEQDFKDFDQAQALFEAEYKNKKMNTQAQAPKPAEMSQYDRIMQQIAEDRAEMGKQRADDKNMALLAAGLGMMGGESPYAFANVGKGGLAGVQYLSEANKQRAAERSALSKSEIAATRYRDLADISKGNNDASLGIRLGELQERQRSNNMNTLNQLEKSAQGRALAALKVDLMAPLDPNTQARINQWVAQDLASNKAYNKIYQDTYGFAYDVAPSSTGSSGTLAEQAAAQLKANKDKEKK
jgi:hypothetical protein